MNRLNIARGSWGGDEGEVGYKRTTWGMLVTGMFCNSDNIPVLMLYYNLGGCHHWGKLSKGQKGLLCIISYMHVNIQWSQNKKSKRLVFASHLTKQFPFSVGQNLEENGAVRQGLKWENMEIKPTINLTSNQAFRIQHKLRRQSKCFQLAVLSFLGSQF